MNNIGIVFHIEPSYRYSGATLLARMTRVTDETTRICCHNAILFDELSLIFLMAITRCNVSRIGQIFLCLLLAVEITNVTQSAQGQIMRDLALSFRGDNDSDCTLISWKDTCVCPVPMVITYIGQRERLRTTDDEAMPKFCA